MTTRQRNKCFEVRITSQEPEVAYNNEEVVQHLNGIPDTQVLATSHRGTAHYYLIWSDKPRAVGYYYNKTNKGTIIPYRVDSGVNSKTKAVSTWLYNKNTF